MRTTLNLPDDLMRTVKVRAAQNDRTITETLTELVRQGLAGSADATPARVSLPLICTPRRASAKEMAPGRIAAILAAEDLTDLAT